MKGKKCVICGFDKVTQEHHIIKKVKFGSDDKENLIYLCLNHHWVADFGTEEDRLSLLKIIKERTHKIGKEIPFNEKKRIDDLSFILIESSFVDLNIKEEDKEEWRQTQNYEICKNHIIGRNAPQEICDVIKRKAEILLLIKILKEELNRYRI